MTVVPDKASLEGEKEEGQQHQEQEGALPARNQPLADAGRQ